jgi:hypothetical protein
MSNEQNEFGDKFPKGSQIVCVDVYFSNIVDVYFSNILKGTPHHRESFPKYGEFFIFNYEYKVSSKEEYFNVSPIDSRFKWKARSFPSKHFVGMDKWRDIQLNRILK